MLKNNLTAPQSVTRWFRTPQEMRLAAALALVLLSAVGYRVWIASQSLWSTQHARIEQLRTGITELQEDLEQNEKATRINRERQRTSLPSDSTLAATRYYGWLHELTAKHGWTEVKIDNTAPVNERALGDRIVHSIQARATIEAIGTWMEEFQEFPLLHSLTHLQIVDYSPLSHEARVQLSIETLSLSDAPVDMQLQMEHSESHTEGRLSASLKRSNPFRRFEPPRPVAVTPKTIIPQVDHLSKVKFVGIVQRNGAQQAWFYDALQQSEMLVATGDPLQVDNFDGKLAKLNQTEATFTGPHGEFTIRLGQDLRAVLGPEPMKVEEANENSAEPSVLPRESAEGHEKPLKDEASTPAASSFQPFQDKSVSEYKKNSVFIASGRVR